MLKKKVPDIWFCALQSWSIFLFFVFFFFSSLIALDLDTKFWNKIIPRREREREHPPKLPFIPSVEYLTNETKIHRGFIKGNKKICTKCHIT